MSLGWRPREDKHSETEERHPEKVGFMKEQ